MARPDQPSLRLFLLLAIVLAGGVGLGLRQAHANAGRATSSPATLGNERARLSHFGEVAGPAQLQWSGRADGPRTSPLRRLPHLAAAPSVAGVELVLRGAELNRGEGLKQGRLADQPPLITCPAQGPPHRA